MNDRAVLAVIGIAMFALISLAVGGWFGWPVGCVMAAFWCFLIIAANKDKI